MSRAVVATVIFSIAGIIALFAQKVGNAFLVPHVAFYAWLTINTYFSILFFAPITPPSITQSAIDVVLGLVYLALAFSIGYPVAFSFAALAIFTIAPLKYMHLVGKTPHDLTMRKKINIDLLGTMLCIFTVVLTVLGYELFAAWMLASVFVVANVYLLFVQPMYRLVQT
jgi:hypothetical protein